MNHLKVVGNDNATQFSRLKHLNAIEQGRANALDLLLKGAPLKDILCQLIDAIEDATPGLICSILHYDESTQSLFPLVAPSLPERFLHSLQGVKVGPQAGCCGAAVFHRKTVAIEDISNHPNWVEHREVAISIGLKSCWSHPIISPNGAIYGAFAMYFSTQGLPQQDDLNSLEYEAKVVALILERAANLEQMQRSKIELTRRVEERTKELTEANVLLKKALSQRNEVQSQLVEMENMAALGTMMSSLTHEINTPVGVAITAISHLRNIQQQTIERFNNGELKRSQLNQFFDEASESAEIIERNLVRSTQLIKSFKQLSIDQHSQDCRLINMCSYIDEILLTLKPRLKRTQHKMCIDVDPDLEFISNPGAISQLLINLIMNSAQHGFDNIESGHIFIKTRLIEQIPGTTELQLIYRDNGKGMSPHVVDNIYKPFFTQARHAGGSGLGMHICYNLVVKILEGQITCHSSLSKGVEFTITFPVELT